VTTICEPQQKSRQRKMLTEHRKVQERETERESWNSIYKIYCFSDIGCWHRNANGWKRYKSVVMDVLTWTQQRLLPTTRVRLVLHTKLCFSFSGHKALTMYCNANQDILA